MAHKHNRRRVRPRSRRNKSQDLDPFANSDLAFSLATACPSGLPSPSFPKQSKTFPQSILSSSTNTIAARHWHNRYIAWQNRDNAQRREATKIEAEQIKLFGGEPGEHDEAGLCYKMMELFEGMEWIESDTI